MDKIEVTQADRTLYHQLLSLGSVNLNRRRMGLPIVDGFELIAAHRLATRTDATPVATDVAALVEAATAVLPFMAQMRGGMCMKIDGKIVDAGSAHHALSAALAPFTKGQNDE